MMPAMRRVTPPPPKPVQLSDILAEMDRRGMSHTDQRRELRHLGFQASYKPGHQSLRETARRARQFKLCAGGCGRQGITNAVQTCEACLEARWVSNNGDASTRRYVHP